MNYYFFRSGKCITCIVTLLMFLTSTLGLAAFRPAVLLDVWHGTSDLDYMKRLGCRGVEMYAICHEEQYWDLLKNYNVLIMLNLLLIGGMIKNPDRVSGSGPDLEKKLSVFDRLEAPAAIGCQSNKHLIWQQAGPVKTESVDWVFESSSKKGELTYYPDEGYYMDRGGKLVGPKIPMPDAEFNYYQYTFDAKSPIRCYWGMDFYEPDGTRIAGDLYTSLYESDDRVTHSGIFYGRVGMAAAQPFFQSTEALSIWNPQIEHITATEAAEWCDQLYAQLPPLEYVPPKGRFEHLPKTMQALNTDKPWCMLLLGHSLVNDTYNSVFPSLIQRLYPQSNLKVIWSGRGGTGCEHYKDHMQQYVYQYKPDVVVIGGISKTYDIDHIASVVRQIKRNVGCEIMIMSQPFGGDPRENDKDNPDMPLPKQKIEFSDELSGRNYKVSPVEFLEQMRQLAEDEDLAYMAAKRIWFDYLGSSCKPYNWFNRDRVHANDRGKQIMGRVYERYFDDQLNR